MFPFLIDKCCASSWLMVLYSWMTHIHCCNAKYSRMPSALLCNQILVVVSTACCMRCQYASTFNTVTQHCCCIPHCSLYISTDAAKLLSGKRRYLWMGTRNKSDTMAIFMLGIQCYNGHLHAWNSIILSKRQKGTVKVIKTERQQNTSHKFGSSHFCTCFTEQRCVWPIPLGSFHVLEKVCKFRVNLPGLF